MVELVDGSIIAQLGVTDMRLPIQYAFSYPERWGAQMPSLDLAAAQRLDFEAPDTDEVSVPRRWRSVPSRGDAGLPVVLNAANEVAVAAFLDGRLRFTGIPDLISTAMDAYEANGPATLTTLADVRAVDSWAREFATRSTGRLQSLI